MTPEEYMLKYLNLTVDLTDGSLHQVSIDRYLNHGMIKPKDKPTSDTKIMSARAREAEAARYALRQAITAHLRKLTAEQRKRFFVHYKPLNVEAVNRPFMGKGSPQEICDVIWLASTCNLLNRATLNAYCNAHLGLDCNGFASNYWGLTHPKPENAGSIVFNVRPRTKIGDIKNGDAIVEFKNGGSRSNKDDAKHVAVVAGQPTVLGNVLSFSLVQSAGKNGNIGLEIVHGKSWELKKEASDGQLYFQAAERRCYFAAGPPKKAVPR